MATETDGTTPGPPPAAVPRPITIVRTRGDRIFRRVAKSSGLLTFLILGLIGLFLLIEAWPALQDQGLKFFTQLRMEPTAARHVVRDRRAAVLDRRDRADRARDRRAGLDRRSALFITEYAPAMGREAR